MRGGTGAPALAGWVSLPKLRRGRALRAARRHPKTFQCNVCHHQTSLIAGTLFEATKLRLTVWFLAIYLIGEAKIGLCRPWR